MCPSLLAHATHIQGDESVAEQVTMKSLNVLWTDLVQQRLLNSLQYAGTIYSIF